MKQLTKIEESGKEAGRIILALKALAENKHKFINENNVELDCFKILQDETLSSFGSFAFLLNIRIEKEIVEETKNKFSIQYQEALKKAFREHGYSEDSLNKYTLELSPPLLNTPKLGKSTTDNLLKLNQEVQKFLKTYKADATATKENKQKQQSDDELAQEFNLSKEEVIRQQEAMKKFKNK